jgi:hypothetical protein
MRSPLHWIDPPCSETNRTCECWPGKLMRSPYHAQRPCWGVPSWDDTWETYAKPHNLCKGLVWIVGHGLGKLMRSPSRCRTLGNLCEAPRDPDTYSETMYLQQDFRKFGMATYFLGIIFKLHSTDIGAGIRTRGVTLTPAHALRESEIRALAVHARLPRSNAWLVCHLVERETYAKPPTLD